MRVSVVMPTRNRVALLERCLQKLLAQDMPAEELEIIVVDDGSTDETSERVGGIAAQSRVAIRLIKGEGRGPAVARNIGWRAAKAPIILFTDDDCEPSSSWARVLSSFLESQTAYGGAGGEIRRLRDSWPARFTDDVECMNHPGEESDVYYLVSANAGYRRSELEMVGGFSEVFPCAGGEDPELSHRVRARGGKLAKVAGAVVLHNHPTSIGGVYQMHFRYGRGESLQQGGCGARGGIKMLVREWRESVAKYRRRGDLPILNRAVFCFFNFVRCFALYRGFIYESGRKNSSCGVKNKKMTIKQVAKAILRRLRLYHPTPPVYINPPTPLQSCFDGLVQMGFKPKCMVDVGANHGNWTRNALLYFPDLQVVMVEPQDWLRADMEDLLQSNTRVHWVTAGASNQEGSLSLTIRERDDSSNFLLSAEDAAAQGLRQVDVPVTTVKALVEKFDLPVPDIIKIDAEGLDLKVLEGCGSLLGATDLFFVEASLMPHAKDNAFVEMVNFMERCGYVLFDVTDLNRSPNCGALCLMELAFVREGSWLRSQVRW